MGHLFPTTGEVWISFHDNRINVLAMRWAMRHITYIYVWYQGELVLAWQHVAVTTILMKPFWCYGVSIWVIDPMDSAVLRMMDVKKLHRRLIIRICDLIKYKMRWDTMPTAAWHTPSHFLPTMGEVRISLQDNHKNVLAMRWAMRQITYISHVLYQWELFFEWQHAAVTNISMKPVWCYGIYIWVIDPMDSAVLGMMNVKKLHGKLIIHICDLIKYKMRWDTMPTATWHNPSHFLPTVGEVRISLRDNRINVLAMRWAMRQIAYISHVWYQWELFFEWQHVAVTTILMKPV